MEVPLSGNQEGAVHARRVTLDDGIYRSQTRLTADSQWEYSTAQYYIDEEYQRPCGAECSFLRRPRDSLPVRDGRDG